MALGADRWLGRTVLINKGTNPETDKELNMKENIGRGSRTSPLKVFFLPALLVLCFSFITCDNANFKKKNFVLLTAMERAAFQSSSGDDDPLPDTDPDPGDTTPIVGSALIVADHSVARLSVLNAIPAAAIAQAKTNLHIAYGHTSHGSQITTGMTGLYNWRGATYAYNSGGSGGALDLREPFPGDLGNPDRTSWATSTRNYLNSHSEINVIIWSWCGQADTTEANINTYLNLMNQLESEYPAVRFVYMTGHLVGTGLTGNLHLRNEQIRAYCIANNKLLFDFADIESYDPSNNYYGDKYATDGCNYDFNASGATTQTGDPAEPTGGDHNWATDWQNAHPGEWFNCSSAHSKPLNANMKAYAAWWLWARLGGWNGQ